MVIFVPFNQIKTKFTRIFYSFSCSNSSKFYEYVSYITKNHIFKFFMFFMFILCLNYSESSFVGISHSLFGSEFGEFFKNRV